MKQSVKLTASAYPYTTAVIFVCILLFFQADLKVTVWPYIHWAVALSALVMLIGVKNIKIKINKPDLLMLLLIPLAMAINFLIVPSIGNAVQTYKVAIIFISCCLISNFISLKNLKNILSFSLILNVVFLLLGILGTSWFARIFTGDGRWGAFFNHPGSLYKVGLFIIVFGMYGLIRSRNKIIYLIITASSLFVMYMDGSRTAFILLGISLLYIIIILTIEYLIRGNSSTALRLLAVFVVTSVGLTLAVNYKPVQDLRIYKTVLDILSGEGGGLAKADNIRYDMLARVQEEITQHPIVGIGMGNTATIVNGEAITIHNAYLQLWSDAGMLAALALVLLMLYGVFRSRVYIRAALQTEDINHSAQLYNLSFLLIIMPVTNIFHPFSTEWSDWSAYLLALACAGVLRRVEGFHENR